MPTIINPAYRENPIGKAIADLGKSYFGDRMSGAINQEKYNALARENAGAEQLAQLFEKPDAVNLGDVMRHGILSGRSGGDIGEVFRTFAANQYGSGDQRTTNSMLGAGQSMAATPEGFNIDQSNTMRRQAIDLAQKFKEFQMAEANKQANAQAELAEKARQFDMGVQQVVTPEGQVVYAPTKDAYGQLSPVSETDAKGVQLQRNFGNVGDLPPAEQTILGANKTAGTPKNYVANGQSFITYDGVTDAQSGQPLPPGGYIANAEGTATDVGLGKPVVNDVQKAAISLQDFDALAGHAETLMDNPANFGPTGLAKSVLQELIASGRNLASGVGADNPDQTIAQVRDKLAADGVNPSLIPELYDPKLPEIEAVWGLLLYSGAAALAGQENRSVSDKDIAMMRNIIGDPHALFTSRDAVKAKLDTARKLVQGRAGRYQQILDQGLPRVPDPNAQTQPQPAQTDLPSLKQKYGLE